MAAHTSTSVAVIGGGITGLATAWYLKQQGIAVTLYEKDERVGGALQTRRQEEWLTELGPNTLMVRDERVWRLLEDLGLEARILEAGRGAKKRFIVKEGRPHPLPMSPVGLLTTPLFSARAKFRLLGEPFVSAPGPSAAGEESIAEFVRRRLGPEILDYAVNPFVAGIYAGDPAALSLRHTFPKLHHLEQAYGSLFRGMLKSRGGGGTRRALISFEQGLQELPAALRRELGEAVHTGTGIREIRRTPEGPRLQLDDGSEASFRAVVSTMPPPRLAEVLQGGDEAAERAAATLAALPYAPVGVLHLGFREEQVGHPLDGFGMLVPEAEGSPLLGTLFSSSLFPGRAPDGHVLLTSFIGGARRPALALEPADVQQELLLEELDRFLGITGSPAFVRHTRWTAAIPQYEIGYGRYLEAMERLEQQVPGLLLAGNYRGGVSVPDCIGSAVETAEKAAVLI